MEVDHDQKEVFSETMQLDLESPDVSLMQASSESVVARLTNPIVTTYLDTDKISFERLGQFQNWRRWLSGRALNSGASGPGFEPHNCHIVSLSNSL